MQQLRRWERVSGKSDGKDDFQKGDSCPSSKSHTISFHLTAPGNCGTDGTITVTEGPESTSPGANPVTVTPALRITPTSVERGDSPVPSETRGNPARSTTLDGVVSTFFTPTTLDPVLSTAVHPTTLDAVVECLYHEDDDRRKGAGRGPDDNREGCCELGMGSQDPQRRRQLRSSGYHPRLEWW